MIEWDDDAIVLAVRRHGETAVLASLFCAGRGLHRGLVPGGVGRDMRAALQPGNAVRAAWRARLADHLGQYRIEVTRAFSACVLDDAAALAAITAACALCEASLPERQPHPALFAALAALLGALASPSWPSVYVHWELALLRDLGFGLDLSACAVTGSRDTLTHVSPKSGRAVSAAAAAPYADRLLALPSFLVSGQEGSPEEVRKGLVLTGFFLERHVFSPRHRAVPPARERLFARLGGAGAELSSSPGD